MPLIATLEDDAVPSLYLNNEPKPMSTAAKNRQERSEKKERLREEKEQAELERQEDDMQVEIEEICSFDVQEETVDEDQQGGLLPRIVTPGICL